MIELIHKIPIVTTLFSVIFFISIAKHWNRKRQSTYLLWWTIGVFCYGFGTFTESLNTIFGWKEDVFRLWYISGALLGGAPLAQGTAYLFLKKRTANFLTVLLVGVIITASVFVLLSPVDYTKVEPERLTGKVLEWQQARLFSPFINIYAFIFLVGGAVYSAWVYYKDDISTKKAFGNIFIAIGALLPGIGGSFTRFGYTEVLYVTELIGLVLIFAGYQVIKNDHSSSIHQAQAAGMVASES